MSSVDETCAVPAMSVPRPLISVVIPVYRSEKTLIELHERLVGSLKSITSEFEILLVDDRGGDNSWEVIKRLSREDRRVRGIRLSRNFGQLHWAEQLGGWRATCRIRRR